jgi:hypothetical protein
MLTCDMTRGGNAQKARERLVMGKMVHGRLGLAICRFSSRWIMISEVRVY